MKLSMVLFMAGFLIRQEKDLRKPWMGFLKTLLIIGIADLLILFETDLGATLIVSLTALAMLYAAGSYLKQLGIVTFSLFALVGVIIINYPNRLNRLVSFWSEDLWRSDAKIYQTQQALIGIARGDWFGTGLGAGIQKYYLLPERHTDMIFAVIGEELGVLGMLFVLLSFLYILLKGFSIAKLALQKGRHYSSLHLVCDANNCKYWYESWTSSAKRIYIAIIKLWRHFYDFFNNCFSYCIKS